MANWNELVEASVSNVIDAATSMTKAVAWRRPYVNRPKRVLCLGRRRALDIISELWSATLLMPSGSRNLLEEHELFLSSRQISFKFGSLSIFLATANTAHINYWRLQTPLVRLSLLRDEYTTTKLLVSYISSLQARGL